MDVVTHMDFFFKYRRWYRLVSVSEWKQTKTFRIIMLSFLWITSIDAHATRT